LIRSIAKKIPGARLLRGGWPDEARLIIQTPVFRRLLAQHEPAGSCLNAGCGEGLFVPFLSTFPALTRIVHMDVSKPLPAVLPDSRHKVVEGSIVDLPFADSEFDFVFCTEVIEHIDNDAAAFREIARALRPNGLTLISTPTPPAPFDPAHEREGYTLPELSAALNAVGLKILSYSFCMFGSMRLLLKLWRWQYDLTGGRKSWMPRAVLLALAHCDRWFPIGKPFDIVVLAQKITNAEKLSDHYV
jgi:SAM-dependent methyltransferase